LGVLTLAIFLEKDVTGLNVQQIGPAPYPSGDSAYSKIVVGYRSPETTHGCLHSASRKDVARYGDYIVTNRRNDIDIGAMNPPMTSSNVHNHLGNGIECCLRMLLPLRCGGNCIEMKYVMMKNE
jgi:hypothetical protein